eukprot:gene13189-27896_t
MLSATNNSFRKVFENTKKLPANSAILKIRCNYLPKDQNLTFEFSPTLSIGEDFEILPYDKYLFPPQYRHQYRGQNNTYETINLKLLKGKSWANEDMASVAPVPLFITAVYVIANNKFEKSSLDAVQVATIVKPRRNCPKIPKLPGASNSLMKYLTDILTDCEGLKVYQSKKLNRRHHNSIHLLDMEPRLLLVDGSDQSLSQAAKAVDHFLAAHSVLDIAWEPLDRTEPSWWVLVPRPPGMPGHLFAMIDTVQWRHPLVNRAENYYRTHRNVSTDKQGILHWVPGCPGTLLKRFFASGYNADTGTVTGGLRKAMYLNIPFQAAPIRLGYRGPPPVWGGTLGWSYTFQG